MKLVINKCYGGFGLSLKAIKRIAEIQGRECYFFRYDSMSCEYRPINPDNVTAFEAMSATAFDISNPEDFFPNKRWIAMSDKEREKQNSIYEEHVIPDFKEDRSNPVLVQVVEELGKEASGACSKLKVIAVPDGIKYQIDEYDGLETVEEIHRSWG